MLTLIKKSGHICEFGSRIRLGQHIALILPSGNTYAQLNSAVNIVHGNGNEETIHFDRDAMGAGRVLIHPQSTGVMKLWLSAEGVENKESLTGPVSKLIVEANLDTASLSSETIYETGQTGTCDIRGHQLDKSTLPPVTNHSMTSLSFVSVVAQRLGSMKGEDNEWDKFVQYCRAAGFNAVHFTPVQQMGASNSSYSLADFISPDPHIASDWEEVVQMREKFEKAGIRIFGDLVLNHIASTAPVLKTNPQMGFNEKNCPWLTGAVELDNLFKVLNDDIVDGRVHNLSKHISSQKDVESLVGCVEERLNKFNLGEWCSVDVDGTISCWRKERNEGTTHQKKNEMAIRVDGEDDYGFVKKVIRNHVGVSRRFIVTGLTTVSDEHVIRRALNDAQNGWLKELCSEIRSSVINSVRGTVEYERLRVNKGPLGKEPWTQFVPRFFSTIDDDTHLANNGWVMGDCDDFTAPGALIYLKRQLVAWSDCVKLRYSDDTPFLWDYVCKYAKMVARAYHGVRLDNCHSTPIHVAQVVLSAARSVNPNIAVIAELFTGSQEADIKFETELGIDGLIREAVQTDSPNNQAWYGVVNYAMPVHAALEDTVDDIFDGALSRLWIDQQSPTVSPGAISAIDDGDALCLSPAQTPVPTTPFTTAAVPKARRCNNIFFDCTHDNEPFYKLKRLGDVLSCAAIVCASGCGIGTTLGYDLLYSDNPSVIVERDPRDAKKTNYSSQYGALPVKKTLGRSESSLKQIIFKQGGNANRVEVWGTFNRWAKGIAMQKSGSHWTLGSELLGPPNSDLMIKFVVDGRWVTTSDYPLGTDVNGNTNNMPFKSQCTYQNPDLSASGITSARLILNNIHHHLQTGKFDACQNIDYVSDDLVVITRINADGETYVFVVRSHWWSGAPIANQSLTVQGSLTSLELCCKVDDRLAKDIAEGRANRSLSVLRPISSPTTTYSARTDETTILLNNFEVGSVCIYKGRTDTVPCNINKVLENGHISPVSSYSKNCNEQQQGSGNALTPYQMGRSGAESLSWLELNYILWSCEAEEKDRSKGTRGVYRFPISESTLTDKDIHPAKQSWDGEKMATDIPEVWHQPEYAGLMGTMDMIRLLEQHAFGLNRNLYDAKSVNAVRKSIEHIDGDVAEGSLNPYIGRWGTGRGWYRCLNTGILSNVSQGIWLLDYHVQRVSDALSNDNPFNLWFSEMCTRIKRSKHRSQRGFLILNFFKSIFAILLDEMVDRLKNTGLWSSEIYDPLWIRLSLASCQFTGIVNNSRLSPVVDFSTSAGLPFFTTEYMREWGRDTCLALPGILIYTGRFDEARKTLITYGNVVRHAQVPNLLDSSNNSRFNARDATWFWMIAVMKLAAYDPSIMDATINLKYPFQDLGPRGGDLNNPTVNTVRDLVLYILDAHWNGIEYREWNAGLQIDAQMVDQGFNVKIVLNEHGFPVGGNQQNCGTWMDKMGSSYEAGNKGVPATPRDGAPVEIVCALYQTLKWILSSDSSFGSSLTEERKSRYTGWYRRITDSFHTTMFVDQQGGYFKDVFSGRSQDLNIRCNAPVGLSYAPGIDSKPVVQAALSTVDRELMDDTYQIGIKTLNRADPRYRPNYVNDDQSKDPSVAHGFNYHCGPEWVWPLGSYLQAVFATSNIAATNIDWVRGSSDVAFAYQHGLRHLQNIRACLARGPWYSLPEVTNRDGLYCPHSCQAQAWSISTVLESLYIAYGNAKSETFSSSSIVSRTREASPVVTKD